MQDLTIAQVAEILQVHRTAVYKLIDSGELIAYRIGKRSIRIRAASLDDYRERKQIQPKEKRELIEV